MSYIGSYSPDYAEALARASSTTIYSAPVPGTPRLDVAIEYCAPLTGIPEPHLRQLAGIAQRLDCVIALRPFDPINAQLILANYPTKGLEIKGKTSDLGPLYGFVPLNQALSKLRHKGRARVSAANDNLRECIAQNKVRAINLQLSLERLRLLQERHVVESRKQPDSGHLTLHVPGSDLVFTAEPAGNFKMNILLDGEPVQVLAPNNARGAPTRDKPLTADYDLLAVIAHRSASTGEGQASRADPTSDKDRDRAEQARTASKVEDQVGQAINSELRPGINLSIEGGFPAWKLIHHGASLRTPDSDMAENFPATVILPRDMHGYGQIVVLNNETELNEFLQRIAQHYPLGSYEKQAEVEARTTRSGLKDANTARARTLHFNAERLTKVAALDGKAAMSKRPHPKP